MFGLQGVTQPRRPRVRRNQVWASTKMNLTKLIHHAWLYMGPRVLLTGAPTLEIAWCTMKFNSVSHTHFEISAVDAFGIFADRRCRSRTSVSFASGPST